jgi:hypothetical protein
MGNRRRSSNLRWRKREASGPLGVILILYIYLHKKSKVQALLVNAKIVN